MLSSSDEVMSQQGHIGLTVDWRINKKVATPVEKLFMRCGTLTLIEVQCVHIPQKHDEYF